MKLMADLRFRRIGTACVAALFVSACGIFSGGNDGDAIDRTGRVDMVLAEQKIEADPDMAAVAVILPEPRLNTSWPQSGSRATKEVGHVQAGVGLKRAWKINAGKGTSTRSALSVPPVTDENAVFVLDADQTLRSFDIETGRRNWQYEIKSGSKRDKRSLGGGLAIDGSHIYVASGFGLLQKLNTEDGSMVWSRDLSAPMTGSPTVKDGRVYATSQNNEIFAFNAEDGATLWSDQAIAETAKVLGSPSPAAIEDILVAPFSSGEVVAYLSSNGRRLWSDALSRTGRFTPISSINDVTARPVLARGFAFAASQSGLLVAIDGRTGNRIWVKPIGSTQAPALAGEFLFVSGIDGKIVCFTARSGGVVWATQLPAFENEKKKKGRISYAGPLIASNRVIVISTEGDLVALSPQTGEVLDTVDLKSSVYIEPIAAKGKILVLTDDGELIALE
ncbi:MAG: PQQ-binding-like beta-propeller repeat protein [Pseudomonadota bacterium]